MSPESVAPKTSGILCVFFSLPIDGESVRGLLAAIGGVGMPGSNFTSARIAVNSTGGIIPDGIALYNALRALRGDITVYNIGSVQSVAAVAFLGCPKRAVSKNALFMYHRATLTVSDGTADQIANACAYVSLEDERIDAILREHIQFDERAWAKLKSMDLHVSPDEAVRLGIADRIEEFVVPEGAVVFTVCPPKTS